MCHHVRLLEVGNQIFFLIVVPAPRPASAPVSGDESLVNGRITGHSTKDQKDGRSSECCTALFPVV